jgi:polysaccharide pyruvyl transferase WcaK-like protein
MISSGTGCDAVRFVQSESGVSQVFGSLRESELMISNRLHSLLFGWASGVIPVAVVDDIVDEKIVSLFGSLGLGGLVVLVSEVDRLPEVLREISAQADVWRKKLSQVFEKQNQVLVDTIERLYH